MMDVQVALSRPDKSTRLFKVLLPHGTHSLNFKIFHFLRAEVKKGHSYIIAFISFFDTDLVQVLVFV